MHINKKIVILLSFVLALGITGCNSSHTSTNSTISENSVISTVESSEPAEPNTFKKVSEISKQASSDSKISSNNDKNEKEAIKWLKENIDNIYDNNDNMEKAMYYGFLLEDIHSGMNDKMYETGMQAEMAVKYVYSGNDKIDDFGTQRHYSKLKELLKQI